MRKKLSVLIMAIMAGTMMLCAEEAAQDSPRQRAEAEAGKGNVPAARSLFIRAFDDYARRRQTAEAVECGVRATQLYYKENSYQEAFDMLRRIDTSIAADAALGTAQAAALRYQTVRERFRMYLKMRRSASAHEQLAAMERHAAAAANSDLRDDLLYNTTLYYYTFGQNDKAGAAFSQMVARLTAKQEYGKADEVYQALIASGQRSGSASLVAQSYSSYMAWKDSVDALRHAAQIDALRQQTAEAEAQIEERDQALAARQHVILSLGVLAAALAVALALAGMVLMRYIVLTRKQKKALRLAADTGALKARFISNIAAQMEPTLRRLDQRQPEVQALQAFATHVQTLSELENGTPATIEPTDTPVAPLCQTLADRVRPNLKPGVTLTVSAPKMNAPLRREHVEHILLHLLHAAAEHTPEGGHITLEYKKRSARKHQFVVTNTGTPIPEEQRDELFKPFRAVRDLTTGDGLGLPICKQMALRMNGDLTIDPTFSKGTRFVLDIQA